MLACDERTNVGNVLAQASVQPTTQRFPKSKVLSHMSIYMRASCVFLRHVRVSSGVHRLGCNLPHR